MCPTMISYSSTVIVAPLSSAMMAPTSSQSRAGMGLTRPRSPSIRTPRLSTSVEPSTLSCARKPTACKAFDTSTIGPCASCALTPMYLPLSAYRSIACLTALIAPPTFCPRRGAGRLSSTLGTRPNAATLIARWA